MDQATNPAIEVACRENADFYEFSIIDRGQGISEEDCKNAFKPMWRHPDKTAEGSGLGLHFVKKIVEIHGGNVWVESELGRGSTFYLSFPKTVPTDEKNQAV